MARSPEQNRMARERSRESLLEAAIDVFAERGIDGATIADITGRAGVAQGLVNYYFGGKEQLVQAVIDRWFDMLLGIAHSGPPPAQGRTPGVDGAVARPAEEQARPPSAASLPPEVRLAAIIDTALGMTAVALPLQRVVVALQQQPTTRALFAEGERRHMAGVVAAEDAVRSIFRERGDADPALEEIMLRSVLDGIVGQRIVYGDSYPLEQARRWVHRRYGLPEPDAPLPGMTKPAPGSESEPRARASR
ncbi:MULTISPECIES: TetR/AcrR family transcriptional regulator [unclassified Microbacterium]|uniref:TetR/AcrR family transcriptional regulator n=1 Tax=unclassified Microbacterium TaxID=2609290 RepID=UPI001E5A04D6|nr:TetR/AcrR family transcriptional regulator [Microbacterium sp. Au-Mic1]MCE4027524.1 TetR/AcrR family transcriptional regulator [Microbacterium sp. Au-Mic1]